MSGSNLPVLRLPEGSQPLPDNAQWTNRFEIKSETSNRIYIISQHKTHRHFGCSCPGWRIHRACKHLAALQLPFHEQPHEVKIQK